MQHLMQVMPASPKAFEVAKRSVLSQLSTQRVVREQILFDYEKANRKGLDYDIRKEIYAQTQRLSLDDITDFHTQSLRSNPCNILVMGSKKHLDFQSLQNYGLVQEIGLEELFGYTKESS